MTNLALRFNNPTDISLTLDQPDTGEYGQKYGAINYGRDVTAAFTGQSDNLRLSVTGFDIDTADEVSVSLNGTSIGYLTPGPIDSLSPEDRFAIPAANQYPGQNELRFYNEQSPTFKWGVTDLLLEVDTGTVPTDLTLTPNQTDNGQYGHNYGAVDHGREVIAEFTGTANDLILTVTGFDIDYEDEVSVSLNGTPLGFLSVGPNEQLNGGDSFTIPASRQVSGANYLQFFNERSAGFKWGVTALTLTPDTAPTDAVTYFVHPDHLGTPRRITDAGQTVVWSWVSDPFGTTLADDDPDNNGQVVRYNPRFPGQYFDQETGQHHNYFRDFDPTTGRYLTSDPIGLNGGLNTYAYVKNNPILFIDPLGLEPTIPRPQGEGYFRICTVRCKYNCKEECKKNSTISVDYTIAVLNPSGDISDFKAAAKFAFTMAKACKIPEDCTVFECETLNCSGIKIRK